MNTIVFKLFLSVLICLSWTSSYAFDVNAVLKSKKTNEQKLNIIKEEITRINDTYSIEQKLQIIAAGLTYFTAENDENGINTLSFYKASNLFEQGDYDESISLTQKPLAYFTRVKDKTKEGKCFKLLGLNYTMLGNFEKATKNLYAAREIFEQLKDSNNLAYCFNGLAAVYYYNNQFKKAIEYWNKAIEADTTSNSEKTLSNLGNIGLAYMDLKNYPEAKRTLDKALLLAKKAGDKELASNALTNLVKFYAEIKDYDKAIEYAFNSLEYHKQQRAVDRVVKDYSNLAEIYRMKGDLKSAGKYAKITIEESRKTHNLIELQLAYQNVSLIFHELKRYEEAWAIRDTADYMEDSLFNEESIRKISDLEKKFELSQKQSEIELLNKDKKLKEAELGKTKNVVVFFSVFAIAIVLFSVFLLKANRQKQKANALLKYSNEEIATKNEELNQQNEEIKTQRDEIENQKHLVEEKNKDITDSIRYAKRLQDAILTPEELIKKIVPDSFVLFKPKDILSGDFYWFDEIGDNVYFAAADCTGHGVPGAFMSVVGYNLLKHSVHEHGKVFPNEILDQSNIELSNSLQQSYQSAKVKDGMDCSLCCIDKKTKTLHYAGANNSIYVVTNINYNPEITELKADKQPVGIFLEETIKPFTAKTYQLKEGDTVYLFTDGYADQFGGPKNKKFKYKQFEDLLYSICELPIEKQKIALNNVFEEWKGFNEQTDDVLVIGVKV